MKTSTFIKTNQEQATAAWINYLNQTRINELLDSLNMQTENYRDAIQEIQNTIGIIFRDIIGRNRGGISGMHGFIAEVAECGLENAKSLFQGDGRNVVWINDNGPVDLKRGMVEIQQKFVNAGGKFSLDAVAEHLERYPDFIKNGGRYQIPKDHYNAAIKLSKMPEEEAYRTLSNNSGSYTLRQWRRVHSFFESGKVHPDDMEPALFDYKDVQADAIEKTLSVEKGRLSEENREVKEKIYNAHKVTLVEGAKVSTAAAALEGGTSFCFEIADRIRQGRKIGDFTEDDWKEIFKKSGIGTVKGGVRGAAIYGLTNITTYIIDDNRAIINTPAAVANAAVTASFGIAEQIHLYRAGGLSETELIENSEILCLDTAVSAISSLFGQAIIPIPVLGAVIGNTVGAVLYQMGKDAFSEYEEKLFVGFTARQKAKDQELDEQYKLFIEQLNCAMENYLVILEDAFCPSIEEAFNGSILLAESLGVPSSEILRNIKDVDSYFLG